MNGSFPSGFEGTTRCKDEYAWFEIGQIYTSMFGRFRAAKSIARTTYIAVRGMSRSPLPTSILFSRSLPLYPSSIVPRSQFIRSFETEAAQSHSLQRGNLSTVSSFEDAISLIDVSFDCMV